MSLGALLARSAVTWRDRPAVAIGDVTVATYGALHDRVTRLAGGMRTRLGLESGDRVAIAMKNCPAFAEVMLAIWHAGLAAVPMNAKLHPREFAYILADAGVRACFVTDDLAHPIATAGADIPALGHIVSAESQHYDRLLASDPLPPQPAAPEDLAWLFYTSGTTGHPKGALLTHRNLMTMTLSYFADVDTIGERDCIVHAAPMSHGSGLYLLPHIAKGACQVIPESSGFEPVEIGDLLRRYQGVTMFAAPTMVTRMIASPAIADSDTSGLKTLVYGGGPMYVADCQRALEVLGQKLVQIYGQGEAPMTITALSRAAHMDTDHPAYLDRLASVGIARTDVEVMVADANDNPLPAGEIGEVLVRGDVVMAGYLNKPDATAETLRGGWLHTGDMGAFDEHGFLTLKDRSKDVIISGGSNIYPREVEEVLLRHPDVAEVSVIGRPHPDWTEEVVAVVVARPGTTVEPAALDALCLDHIARFKRPRAYFFTEGLPKNNYGKVLKTDLRAQFGNQGR